MNVHPSCLTSMHPPALCHAFMRPGCCHCQQGCAQLHSDTCWQHLEGGRLLAGPVLLHQVSAASVPTPWVCAHHAWRVTPSLETRHFTNAHCAATCYRNTVLPGASCLGFLFMLKPGESPLGWNTRAAALTAVLPPAAGTHC